MTMQDPLAENISGQKVQKATHSVEWHINVSHVLAFVAVAYVGVKILPALANDGDQENRADHGGDGDRDLVDVNIQGGGLVE